MQGATLPGHVTDVKDGDTFEVALEQGGTATVRLWGVDAPEAGQAYGSHATEAARRLIGSEPVRLHVQDVDRYGRLVAKVRTEKPIDLGRSLLASGYAWYYEEYAPSADHLASLEKQARQEGLGFWTQENPTPPWEWRGTERQPTLLETISHAWQVARFVWRIIP